MTEDQYGETRTDPRRVEALALAIKHPDADIDDTITRAHAYFDFISGGDGYGDGEPESDA